LKAFLLNQTVDNFMNARAQESPYPEHLYRAHLYGSGFSHPVDSLAVGHGLDPIKSDYHLGTESGDIPMEAHRRLGPTHCMAQLVLDLENHLQKTRKNQYLERTNPHYFASPLISLSGSLAWTVHAARLRDKGARQNQLSVVVVCQTSRLNSSDTKFWRVADMIAFFDSDPYFDGDDVSSQSREWANHADEYVCWEKIPHSAVVRAESYWRLAERNLDVYLPHDAFLLREEFLISSWRELISTPNSLRTLRPIARLKYTQMVKRFISPLMEKVSLDADPAALLNSMVKSFRVPSVWKWFVVGSYERLDEGLAWVVDEEYTKGILCWINGTEEQSVRTKVKANIKAMGCHLRDQYPLRLRDDESEPAWWIANVDPEMESVIQRIAGLG
jgi:hypothetical protein